MNLISRILVFYHSSDREYLRGLQFFDRKGILIFESEAKNPFRNKAYLSKEIVLMEGERIVGIKSRKEAEFGSACHFDF